MIIFIISFGGTSAWPSPLLSALLPTQTPPFGEEQSGVGGLSGATVLGVSFFSLWAGMPWEGTTSVVLLQNDYPY